MATSQGEIAGLGYIGRIPVRNIWLLMLYASDLFRVNGSGSLGVEDLPEDLPDLIAEILAHAVESRQRRQLSQGYRSLDAILNRVRGKINLLKTERKQLLARGLVACRYDELTVDTPRNRYVRFALESISTLVKRKELAHRCRALAGVLKTMGVGGNPPTRAQMSTDRFGRHDAEDRYMVSAAKLALEFTLPSEEEGFAVLSLPQREERWVRTLFERAMGGFYDVVLREKGWNVQRGMLLNWQVEKKTVGIDRILPSMRTDIVLDNVKEERRIVIDTKFTSILTKGWYREESLKSGYLYQMYAYLRSQVGGGDTLADKASGLLLHPAIDDPVDETVIIQGHSIRFATVDLSASTNDIRQRLMGFCAPW